MPENKLENVHEFLTESKEDLLAVPRLTEINKKEWSFLLQSHDVASNSTTPTTYILTQTHIFYKDKTLEEPVCQQMQGVSQVVNDA